MVFIHFTNMILELPVITEGIYVLRVLQDLQGVDVSTPRELMLAAQRLLYTSWVPHLDESERGE